MIDIVCDYYKLYLGTFTSNYEVRVDKDTKEEIYEALEYLKNDYDKYIIIGHINSLNEDSVLEYGEIEHIDKPKKKRRIK